MSSKSVFGLMILLLLGSFEGDCVHNRKEKPLALSKSLRNQQQESMMVFCDGKGKEERESIRKFADSVGQMLLEMCSRNAAFAPFNVDVQDFINCIEAEAGSNKMSSTIPNPPSSPASSPCECADTSPLPLIFAIVFFIGFLFSLAGLAILAYVKFFKK